MNANCARLLLAGGCLLAAIACEDEAQNAKASANATVGPSDAPRSLCESLGLNISVRSALPDESAACTFALRAVFAMMGDTVTLRVLGERSLIPTGAELQRLAEKEMGAAVESKFLSVMLRLPNASHDVEVRFSESGAVTYISAVHKPLQQ